MNIFYLSHGHGAAVRYHCDKHVVKQVLETAQILCTALQGRGLDLPYRPTHRRHPCVKWAARESRNRRWLARFGQALADEYEHRYGRVHKSAAVIDQCAGIIGNGSRVQATPPNVTPFDDVPVPLSYQLYYVSEKLGFAEWTDRPVPSWIPSTLRTYCSDCVELPITIEVASDRLQDVLHEYPFLTINQLSDSKLRIVQ